MCEKLKKAGHNKVWAIISENSEGEERKYIVVSHDEDLFKKDLEHIEFMAIDEISSNIPILLDISNNPIEDHLDKYMSPNLINKISNMPENYFPLFKEYTTTNDSTLIIALKARKSNLILNLSLIKKNKEKKKYLESIYKLECFIASLEVGRGFLNKGRSNLTNGLKFLDRLIKMETTKKERIKKFLSKITNRKIEFDQESHVQIKYMIPYHLKIPYLKCPNEIKEIKTHSGKYKLPYCPKCNFPISGGRYIQRSLDEPRFHVDCYFEHRKNNDHYKQEFLTDPLFHKLEKERTERWILYLAMYKMRIENEKSNNLI